MADNGSSSGNGLAFLTKKVGPFPVWLWALAAAGLYYWYTHYGPGKPAAATSPTTSSTTSTTTTSEPVEPETIDVDVDDDDDRKKSRHKTEKEHGEPPISRQHRSKKVRHLEHDIHKDYESSRKNKRKDHTPARRTHPVPPRQPRPVHRRPADQAAASRSHQEAA